MIEQYRFGLIVINGTQYHHDVIVFRDQVIHDWWRASGHELCIADIQRSVDQFQPEIVVVGTGKFGLMKVLPETEKWLNSRQIELIAQKTPQACQTFDKLLESRSVMGAFHLTC
ncbi:MAG: Mth938-like domain-containing protein [candidate division KSB1 bacterium]|nr:Mth938-like domain-containing protein [candidate division KSB1 bacterium]MDZ7335200.1 Mth938-like domain-containing protein [candidate division KSB1 bacterium]MDZ7356513.1 Mth938-like domain-containing protein [candidate division KSB1 bacterium]MDZ7376711.1 Mth938-like domain-containing protein [candidate division KSB1 bacterium]MDZ7400742.1 Mth938-like domain-containing protein [candidate division KSB1 bacterium]